MLKQKIKLIIMLVVMLMIGIVITDKLQIGEAVNKFSSDIIKEYGNSNIAIKADKLKDSFKNNKTEEKGDTYETEDNEYR